MPTSQTRARQKWIIENYKKLHGAENRAEWEELIQDPTHQRSFDMTPQVQPALQPS